MSKPLTCLLSLLTQETLDTGTEHALHRKDTFSPLSPPPPSLCDSLCIIPSDSVPAASAASLSLQSFNRDVYVVG